MIATSRVGRGEELPKAVSGGAKLAYDHKREHCDFFLASGSEFECGGRSINIPGGL